MKELTLDRRINIALLLCITLFIMWYLYDAYSVLASIENLIFIAPIGILTLGLCFTELVNIMLKKDDISEHEDSIRDVLPVMLIFAGYILSLQFLGFDVGTILFIGIFLRIHGETRWKYILFYSITFGLLIPYFFSFMLPYPMPMSILPTDY